MSSPGPTTRHPIAPARDEAFEVLRALAFLAGHLEKVRQTPDMVGPNVRANVEEGLRYNAEDIARGFSLQTTLYHRWQSFFSRYDVILTPAITISPRSWRELYPAEIDGKPTRTYFHWLAMAYAVTVVGHPAISLPVGLDRNGMPFGLQIVGPRGGDALVLRVAAELEALLSGDPRTARPAPDIAALTAAPAISALGGVPRVRLSSAACKFDPISHLPSVWMVRGWYGKGSGAAAETGG